MTNQSVVVFKQKALQTLMDLKPDNIIIRTVVEAGVLQDGSKAGVVNVYADAMREGDPKPLGTC